MQSPTRHSFYPANGRNTISVVNDYFSKTTQKSKLNRETLNSFKDQQTADLDWSPQYKQSL